MQLHKNNYSVDYTNSQNAAASCEEIKKKITYCCEHNRCLLLLDNNDLAITNAVKHGKKNLHSLLVGTGFVLSLKMLRCTALCTADRHHELTMTRRQAYSSKTDNIV
jgi:hypothetical protein